MGAKEPVCPAEPTNTPVEACQIIDQESESGPKAKEGNLPLVEAKPGGEP